ncbi:MAG: MBL fold metallo-hydrolase [candidate division Zixibacteria bacterium HGW-Zixibacteria-1]|nr:MAG: MBL fold metallo-hydrolase [candidate division Zixibacteria bacterium HGW-Zixibacteria-1]
MKPLEIKKDIFGVGAIDWNLRDFHGYSTEKGTTYNSYLVMSDKTVLFDTVKAAFADEFIADLKSVLGDRKLDYIVSNHAEMDHSGALPAVMQAFRPEKVICTKACQDALNRHFHGNDWPFELIKEGDELNLGNRTVQFFGSAMIHWPESMVSLLKEDKLLISNDIFGQHWATSERYDDEVDQGELSRQSAKYYANIFLPTSPAVKKFLEKLETKGLEFDMIAPDHGLILRKNLAGSLAAYKAWANWEAKPKAVVIYDTMWESTAQMARAITRGLSGEGVSVKLFDLRTSHRSDIMTDLLDARAVVLGSSILNSGILPKMADMITYMKGLRPLNKIGASFGSYGWKNTITKMLNEQLEEMKVELVDEGFSVQYVPSEDDLATCIELGRKIKNSILGS